MGTRRREEADANGMRMREAGGREMRLQPWEAGAQLKAAAANSFPRTTTDELGESGLAVSPTAPAQNSSPQREKRETGAQAGSCVRRGVLATQTRRRNEFPHSSRRGLKSAEICFFYRRTT
jgi:hypothetical protein